jgi:hypothetical protein
VRLRTTFRLSNNQTKLLFQSRNIIQVAFPVPPEVVADETENWTPKRIVGLAMGVDHEHCSDATFEKLWIEPPGEPWPGQAPTKGTQGVLGRILEPGEKRPHNAKLVDCVVATFHPPFKKIQGKQPLKWPGKIYDQEVEINGQTSTQKN